MYGFDFYKFKLALKEAEKNNYAGLREDVRKVRDYVEKILSSVLECSANQARTNYIGREMH
jgi:hypothetical protein